MKFTSDRSNNATISITANAATEFYPQAHNFGFLVNVEFQERCIRQPPTLDISSYLVSSFQELKYSINISNLDGPFCESSKFSLKLLQVPDTFEAVIINDLGELKPIELSTDSFVTITLPESRFVVHDLIFVYSQIATVLVVSILHWSCL
jgi:hypothetical protein